MDGKNVRCLLEPLHPRTRSLVFPRVNPSLHAMPTAVGYDACPDPGYDWHGLRRGREQFALFQYTLSGEGRLEFAGQKYVVQPGTAMLLHFPHDNRYWLPEGKRWEFFYLCLNGAQVLNAWQTIIHKVGPLVSLSPSSPVVRTAAKACRKILLGEIDSPWSASALAYDLVMKMLETFTYKSPANTQYGRPASIRKAMEHCRRNLAQPIGVEQLAAAAGYSRFHFTRLFLTSEGITPGQFITRERLNRAVELLKFTDQPVKAVAQQCGFDNCGYFCKVFRKTYGVSPLAFRNSGMY